MSVEVPYKTALVTGASRGIGAAICRRLAGLGLTVHALARDGAALDALAAASPGHIVAVPGDVRDTGHLRHVLEGAEIDVLVNNAGGLATVKAIHLQSLEETAATIALNLTAPLQLMQMVLPGMIARRRGPRLQPDQHRRARGPRGDNGIRRGQGRPVAGWADHALRPGWHECQGDGDRAGTGGDRVLPGRVRRRPAEVDRTDVPAMPRAAAGRRRGRADRGAGGAAACQPDADRGLPTDQAPGGQVYAGAT